MSSVLTRRYRPQGTAVEVFNRRDPELLISGPAGTGKSRACLEKIFRMCMINEDMRALIVRKTQTSLGSTGLVTWREHVAKEALASGDVTWYGGSASEPPQYRFPKSGAVIVVGGMDKSTKIMSSEYDLIYVQEATELTEGDWEALTTRLRNGRVSFQQLLADCNPDRPTHWLKVRCDGGTTKMLYARHTDNPTLYRDGEPTPAGRAYLDKLHRLTGVRRLRLAEGVWAAADGLVYDGFDPTVHLVDRFPVPDSWRRFFTIDFGYTNAFTWQDWREDPDGRLYLVNEIYMTRRLVEDHAKDILRVVTEPVPDVDQVDDDDLLGAVRAGRRQWVGPRPSAVICDHDAEDRATLERHLGLSTTAAKKSVSDGIQAFQSRLKVQPDGKPRIAFMRDALVERDPALVDAAKPACLAEEIVGYVWAIKPGGDLKEAPVKENDHGCDGGRYMVAHRDLRKRQNVRTLTYGATR